MGVTPDQMRGLALALPGSEEKAHFEQPDFRVNNKIFAGLARDAKTGSLKLTPELQTALLEARGAAFYPAAGAWGRAGWTHVVLAEVALGELRELLGESWRLVAPKRLGKATSPVSSRKVETRARPTVPAKKAGGTPATKKNNDTLQKRGRKSPRG